MITKIPLKIVSIEDVGYHILIEATINDRVLNILVDTGASATVFNKDSLSSIIDDEPVKNDRESYGIGAASFESYGTIIKSLKLGELEIRNYQAAIMDMSAINSTYEMLGNSRIDGLLGGDILKKYKASIDYSNKVLKLRRRNYYPQKQL